MRTRELVSLIGLGALLLGSAAAVAEESAPPARAKPPSKNQSQKQRAPKDEAPPSADKPSADKGKAGAQVGQACKTDGDCDQSARRTVCRTYDDGSRCYAPMMHPVT